MGTGDEIIDIIRNRIRNLLGVSSIFSGDGDVTYQYSDGTTKTVSENAIIKITSTEDSDVYQYEVTTSNDDSVVSGLLSIKDTTSDADNLRITGIPYNGSGNAQLTFSSNGNYTDFTNTVNGIDKNDSKIVASSGSYSLKRVQPYYKVNSQVITFINRKAINGNYTLDLTAIGGLVPSLSGASLTLTGGFNVNSADFQDFTLPEIPVSGKLANLGNFTATVNLASNGAVVATAEKEGSDLIKTFMSCEGHCLRHNDEILTQSQGNFDSDYIISSIVTSKIETRYV